MNDTDLEAATRLIHYGLRPNARPSHNPEYESLVRRYQGDHVFQHKVQAVAKGFALRVLDVVASVGIVLASTPGSAFAPSAASLRRDIKPDSTSPMTPIA